MSESLITGVWEFLRAARALYGAGDLAAGPPPPAPVNPIRLPPMSGAVAAAHAEAVARHNARFDQLVYRDGQVGSLTASARDSVVFGRKVVEEGSAVFKSSVDALGPFAASPFGIMAVAPVAAGVVASVTDQLARSGTEMKDAAKQMPGQPDADQPRRTRRVVRRRRLRGPVSLASSTQGSGGLSAEERRRFRERLANYAGPVPGMDLALSLAGTPYAWGGFSPSGLDCSGAVAALVNHSLGEEPFAQRMSTHNEAPWLASLGARPGLGGPGDLSIGFTNAGVGHTAATLPDGTNFESSGGAGVRVGAAAAGADDPMFDQHWHIPAALLRGGAASIAV